MMSQMAGQMGMPFGRKGSARKAAQEQGQEGQEGRTRADAAEGAQPAGAAGMPAGFPDLSNMPKGLDELPPGLADIDLSKLKFPGQQVGCGDERLREEQMTLHRRGRGLPDGRAASSGGSSTAR